MQSPKVSVGVPCYDRPDTLDQCLASLSGQSHQNLEILVADDATPNPRVAEIANRHALRDPRIRFVRHTSNIGMIPNFEYVLKNAGGEYFMWSSDDDWWEPDVIASRLEKFRSEGTSVVTVASETLYETPVGTFPFFTEGEAFRDFRSSVPAERIEHLVSHIYGILMYGLHRREALFQDGKTIFSWFGRAYNENSAILMLASKGDILTLPLVGLHKRAPASCAAEQRWVAHGGRLPKSLWSRSKRQLKNLRYHFTSYHDCRRALEALHLEPDTMRRADKAVRVALTKGAWDAAKGWRTQQP